MKKLVLSISGLMALILAGCGGDSIDDIRSETSEETPISRVVFDPEAGNLNIPNDLLFVPQGDALFDFTLIREVDDPADFSNPENALNVLDGWSTNRPFALSFTTAAGVSIDASSAAQGIRIFESTLGLDQTDPDCGAIQVPSAGCKIGDELQFGVDFVVNAQDESTLVVIPLIPFKSSQGYTLVVTTDLLDSEGNAVQGSTIWELVEQDITTNPLSTQSQLDLQGLVNSYINALSQVGLTREQIAYAQVFTTTSVFEVMSTVKGFHALAFSQSQDPADLPAVVVSNQSADLNALEELGDLSGVTEAAVEATITATVQETPELSVLEPLLDDIDFSSLTTCAGLFAGSANQFTIATSQTFSTVIDAALNGLVQGVSQTTLNEVGPLCAASVYEGSISLPYFLAIPRDDNPTAPLNEFWEAACDSAFVIGTAPEALLASAQPGPNDALCSLGPVVRDLRIDGETLDTNRYVTRFNALPLMKGSNLGREIIDVQVTVPNVDVAADLGVTLTKPVDGWPVVMLVHGIGSQKAAMLNISGALTLAGFATVSIDQPLHGSRGFDIDPTNPGDEINATTVSSTAFLNLSSLVTARDNLRQAVSDLLGLRLGLNAVVDATGMDVIDINGNNVSVMGVSLGAMTGGNFAAVANLPFTGESSPLNPLFEVKAASLESPGGGIMQFLLESPTFGGLVTASVLAGGSEDFQAFLATNFPGGPSQTELVQASNTFLAGLDPQQRASVDSLLSQFSFVAQTVVDSGDPVNYFETLGNVTPTHMLTVVGDGTNNNLPDQVIPPTTDLPTSGQLPLARLAQLPTIVSTTSLENPISGLVLFTTGAHGSSLNPASNPDVTVEMQTQVATYLGEGGTQIPINDESLVQN